MSISGVDASHDVFDYFDIQTYDQALTFVEWKNSHQFKFWYDLLTRIFDLSVLEIEKISEDMSLEQAGAKIFIFQGQKKAIRKVLGTLDELEAKARKILSDGEQGEK